MVTFNGRITLPSQLRKELGLKTGDSVNFVEIEKGRFAITPGTGSISQPDSDPKGWIPQLDFASGSDEMDGKI
jgi:AbrB family looped-hinge helix DNA binding protein